MAWPFIERGIAAISPAWALRREVSRLQLDMARGYDAAKGGRGQNSWSRPGTSGSAEVARADVILKNTGRDMVRNNPHAKKGKRIYVANMVGTGIIPTPDTGNKARNRKIVEAFEAWLKVSDLAGRLDFYGQQAQAAGTLFESGGFLTRFYDRSPGPALRLKLMETDFIDRTRFTLSAGTDGSYTDQGVEYDGDDRPVAYWLYRQHPGDSTMALRGRYDSVRVPASDIVHVFPAHMSRPGQNRGVTEYAAVAQKMADLAEFEEATLVGKKIAACFAAFVKRGANANTPLAGSLATKDAQGRRIETLAPGLIQYLSQDEDVVFGEPPTAGDYKEFTVAQLHAIAAGLGVPYELLAADLSQVNYSSYRAGQLDFRRAMEQDQWLMMVPMFCDPVWCRFIDRLVIAGTITPSANGSHYKVEWAMPKFESVDPKKDSDADLQDIRAGTLDLTDAIARRGYNPQRVLEKRAETNKLLDSLGLILDSDPRKTTRAGGPMTSAQPEAAAPGSEDETAAE